MAKFSTWASPTLEVLNAFERILHIPDSLTSYHGLCGYQSSSQGFFSNAEQLTHFFLQPIALS